MLLTADLLLIVWLTLNAYRNGKVTLIRLINDN